MKKPALVDIAVARCDLIDGLAKGVDVIRAFTCDTAQLSAAELAARLGLSRSAARRYLLTLVHIGMAATDGRNFWLTPKVLSLGQCYLDSARLPRAIVPFLQRLTQQLQESTNFAVLDGDQVVYISRVNAPRTVASGFDPGTRLPAHTCTAGRMLLSELPDEALHAYLDRVTLAPFTHQTVTDKTVLLRELMDIRKHGFAVTENQYQTGLRGVSVPLRSRHGGLVGALSVSMLVSACPIAEASTRCVPLLQATANTVMLWV
ncbi:MAG TPA: IclR family transcriptional regulator C-terminal domain-containing protein [Telluria sp.]|jgi:IclR family pca regulon transcriptional regulator